VREDLLTSSTRHERSSPHGGGDADRELTARRAISTHSLAVQLGISDASVLRGCRDGRVRAIRFGKRWLIPPDEADRIMRGGLPAA